MAGIDLFASALSSFILNYLLKNKIKNKIELIIKIYLLLLYAFILATLFLLGHQYSTLFVWVFLVPPLSYLLLGRKWGVFYTAVFIIMESWIFYYTTWNLPSIDIAGAINDMAFCLLVVWVLTHLYEKAHTDIQVKLLDLASKDSLTNLLNRSVLKEHYDRALAKSDKGKVGLIVLDIDRFKNINDTYGHHMGDQALCMIAERIQKSVQKQGWAFRLGGEEFCVLLANSRLQQACELAERIRLDVEAVGENFGKNDLCITISAGVIETDSNSLVEALKLADIHLYAAKNAGRNQVCSA